MPEVKKVPTPLTDEQAVDVISSAYEGLEGRKPTPGVLALLSAQSAFETADWFSFFNNNWGGVKEPDTSRPFFYSVTKERDAQGITHEVHPPDPATQFASNETALEGATHWLRTIKRYPHWWLALHTEEPGAYVTALSAAPPKYFTGSPEAYLAGVNGKLERLLPLFEWRLAVARAPVAPLGSSRPPQSLA